MPRLLVIAALALALSACSKSEAPPAPATPPTPAQASPPAPVANATPSKGPAAARKMIAAGAVVVDVRTQAEFDEDHLPQATNIPIEDFAQRIAEVDTLTKGDKTRPIVVHCAAGSRASKAKQQLEAAGYTQVVNGGGLDDLR